MLVVPVPFCFPPLQRTVHVQNGIAGLDIEATLKALRESDTQKLAYKFEGREVLWLESLLRFSRKKKINIRTEVIFANLFLFLWILPLTDHTPPATHLNEISGFEMARSSN